MDRTRWLKIAHPLSVASVREDFFDANKLCNSLRNLAQD